MKDDVFSAEQTQSAVESGVNVGDPTKSLAFQDWFADSKVVDRRGAPMVVYHGTNADIVTFDPDLGELGTHFGTERQVTTIVKNTKRADLNIIPVYLSLRNPLRFQDMQTWDPQEIWGRLVGLGMVEPDNLTTMSVEEASYVVRSAIKKAGYDGIVYLNRYEGFLRSFTDMDAVHKQLDLTDTDEEFLARFPRARDSYIAFSPTQIKSAVGNRGTFDPDDGDIRLSRKSSAPDTSPEFEEDIPAEEWLNEKVEYAKSRGLTRFGAPFMGATTGWFNGHVVVPIAWAVELKGLRGEQQNVRHESLEYLRGVIRDTGKFPTLDSGKQYVPYVEVGYDGVPWVSEGNHRIMAAAAEGWTHVPLTIRYFDGGQQHAGKWSPNNLLAISAAATIGDPEVVNPDWAQVARGVSRLFQRGQHGEEMNPTYGEAGYGIYAMVPSAEMRRYYTATGEELFDIESKSGAKIVDLSSGANLADLVAFTKSEVEKTAAKMSGYVKPNVTEVNAHRMGYVEPFVQLRFPKSDAYIVKHVGAGIPTGKQVVIKNIDAFDVSLTQIDGDIRLKRAEPQKTAFDTWFDGSAVTDTYGRPAVLYHGTSRAPNGITVFDTENGDEAGTHFGTLEQASQFAEGESGTLYPVYLSIKNPLRLKDDGRFTLEGVAWQLDNMGLPEPKTPGLMEGEYLRARIKEAGYDGVVYLNRREGAHDPFGPDGVDGDTLDAMTDDEVLEMFPDAADSWIAFLPVQVKSAIGNGGNFSPSDPDIRAKRRETIVKVKSAAQLKAIAKQRADASKPDPSRDHLWKAIAKLGGLDKKQTVSTWGADPKQYRPSGVYLRPVLSAVYVDNFGLQRGLSIDDMGQQLAELGYLPKDENGKYDVRDFEEAFRSGDEHFTPQGFEGLALLSEEARYHEEMSAYVAAAAPDIWATAEVDNLDSDSLELAVSLADELADDDDLWNELNNTDPIDSLRRMGFTEDEISELKNDRQQQTQSDAAKGASRKASTRSQGSHRAGADYSGQAYAVTVGSSGTTAASIRFRRAASEDASGSPRLDLLLHGSQVVDHLGRPLVMWHGSRTSVDAIGVFDPKKTIDGAFHFGTRDQARMRAGRGKSVQPVYLAAKKLRRCRDARGSWKSRIQRAKRDGYDGLVYLNRWEGISLETTLRASAQGVDLDALSDADFRRYAPEARDSVMVFSADQIHAVPPSAVFDRDNADDIRLARSMPQSRDDVVAEEVAPEVAVRAAELGELVGVVIAAAASLHELDRKSLVIEDAADYFAKSSALSDAKLTLATSLDGEPEVGFALQANTRGGLPLMLTASAQQHGKWQLTRFDRAGEPWGDTQYPQRLQAIIELLSDIDPASLMVTTANGLVHDQVAVTRLYRSHRDRFPDDPEVDSDTWIELYEEQERLVGELVGSFMAGENPDSMPWPVVPAGKLRRVWSSFIETGRVDDEVALAQIEEQMRDCFARLMFCNAISGHTQSQPHEYLASTVDEDIEGLLRGGEVTDRAKLEALVDWAVDDPVNGRWRISDYGPPKLAQALGLAASAKTAEAKLKYLDRALNVVHMRSDLAALFVEGGTSTLNQMAGSPSQDEEADVRAKRIERPPRHVSASPSPPAGTAAFRLWFGKSQLVDDEGAPRVFYRGDAEAFNTFDHARTREKAFFFTGDYGVAKVYAGEKEPRAFFLRAEKLFTPFSPEGEAFIRDWAKSFDGDGWVDRFSGVPVDPYEEVIGGRLFDYEGDWSSARWRDLQTSIELAGYDGAILPDWDGDKGMFEAVVVFHPNQIKLATGNSGTFRLDSNDIRLKRHDAAADTKTSANAALRARRLVAN